MAYVAPDAATLALRYPAFSAVAEPTIDYWLAEAAQFCALFPDDYRAQAEMAYAAHRLAEQGIGAGIIPSGVTSFKSGTFSATVSDGVASLTGFEATVYGREFLSLRRACFSGPVMAWMSRA